MREESGLTDVRMVGFLGRYLHNAAPHRGEVHDRYVYHLELTGLAEQSWLHYETDPSDGGPPIAFEFLLDEPARPGTALGRRPGRPSPQAHHWALDAHLYRRYT